jgi:cysteinyl-tRNA synthetase
MRLYNTLTRRLGEFKPLKKGGAGIYSCGPTVYWNQHLGHMYAYTQWDVLVRYLRYLGYQVTWVMNITDVGHMTSDQDFGEDKMEKGAQREGLSVWQIADKYIAQFLESLDLLNIQRPDVLCRATEHIQEQIDLIKKIEANGFTYKTKTGLVFDTAKFPDYAKFARLNLGRQYPGSRVEVDPEKKRPWDFLLWVTNQPNHLMQWDSPWGRGFPGWHIECTAMSAKYLGERFDIHTGGKEHIPVHHTNEIAQAFGVFGQRTANFWLHNEWLRLKGGEKMSKSKGNFFTVQDLVAKDIDPLALRYLILTSHYRKGLDFSWEALGAAQTAYEKLKEYVSEWKNSGTSDGGRLKRSPAPDGAGRSRRDSSRRRHSLLAVAKPRYGGARWRRTAEVGEYKESFLEKLDDDLNLPEALAVLWQVAKSDIPGPDKLDLVLDFDKILGLKLGKVSKLQSFKVSREIRKLVEEREKLRKLGKWEEADRIRRKIEKGGWMVEDTEEGSKIKRRIIN